LALKQQLQSANENRAEASKKLEEANAERNALSLTHANKLSTEAEASYREALFHSQLHSFTAMAFGKDPNQVTDGENFIPARIRIFACDPSRAGLDHGCDDCSTSHQVEEGGNTRSRARRSGDSDPAGCGSVGQRRIRTR
jgi:hypothetical protein